MARVKRRKPGWEQEIVQDGVRVLAYEVRTLDEAGTPGPPVRYVTLGEALAGVIQALVPAEGSADSVALSPVWRTA